LARRATEDDVPVYSFQTLLADLASNVRNTCRTPNATEGEPAFEVTAVATAQQRKALDLIAQIQV
jgi:hypothetical protein